MSQLFDDKPRNYAKPARRAETTYSFLDRSSNPEFERVRDMLERWVERLPGKQKKDAVANMRHGPPGSHRNEVQFNGAFFELFLHEFLVGTTGEVVVEPIIDGLTPDFQVTEELADGSQITYVVEATDIDLELGTDLERAWNELTVLDTIDEISSPDFRLHIRMDGKLESVPRKAHLKAKFENLLKEARYEEDLLISQGQGGLNLEHLPSASVSRGSWTLTGRVMPVSPDHRGDTKGIVGIVSRGPGWLDDIGKTKGRLSDKAKRYKNVRSLIIALRCDVSNNRLDEVLFGSEQFAFVVQNDPPGMTSLAEPRYSQKLNGFWFNSCGPIKRDVIGVVAFYEVHPGTLDRSRAVFYSNPYLDKPMPEWTKLITHAEYSDGKVRIVDGVAPHKFLRDYEVIGNPFG